VLCALAGSRQGAVHPHRANVTSLGPPLPGPAVPAAGAARRTARGHPPSPAATQGCTTSQAAACLARTRPRHGKGSRLRWQHRALGFTPVAPCIAKPRLPRGVQGVLGAPRRPV
jgi:hypothetical protein